MSSAVLPGSLVQTNGLGEGKSEAGARPGKPRADRGFVRRRGSPAQGMALESIGHAVEYLMDSRLLLGQEFSQQDEHDAVQLLMQLSRTIFGECAEVVPLRRKIRGWVRGRIGAAAEAGRQR